MLHAISPPPLASTWFPSLRPSSVPARLSLSLSLSRFHGKSYTCKLPRRLSVSLRSSPTRAPWSMNCWFLPIFLPPALAGEGEWCEEAGAAVVTGASELRAEVFKQGRAPGEAMTALSFSLYSPSVGFGWEQLEPFKAKRVGSACCISSSDSHSPPPSPTPPADLSTAE
jgi:hypothetical protein